MDKGPVQGHPNPSSVLAALISEGPDKAQKALKGGEGSQPESCLKDQGQRAPNPPELAQPRLS